MAEWMSRKEHQRRLMLVIACVLVDTISIGVGVFALKGMNDIDHSENLPDNVQRLQAGVQELRGNLRKSQEQLVAFSQPVGWRRSSVTRAT